VQGALHVAAQFLGNNPISRGAEQLRQQALSSAQAVQRSVQWRAASQGLEAAAGVAWRGAKAAPAVEQQLSPALAVLNPLGTLVGTLSRTPAAQQLSRQLIPQLAKTPVAQALQKIDRRLDADDSARLAPQLGRQPAAARPQPQDKAARQQLVAAERALLAERAQYIAQVAHGQKNVVQRAMDGLREQFTYVTTGQRGVLDDAVKNYDASLQRIRATGQLFNAGKITAWDVRHRVQQTGQAFVSEDTRVRGVQAKQLEWGMAAAGVSRDVGAVVAATGVTIGTGGNVFLGAAAGYAAKEAGDLAIEAVGSTGGQSQRQMTAGRSWVYHVATQAPRGNLGSWRDARDALVREGGDLAWSTVDALGASVISKVTTTLALRWAPQIFKGANPALKLQFMARGGLRSGGVYQQALPGLLTQRWLSTALASATAATTWQLRRGVGEVAVTATQVAGQGQLFTAQGRKTIGNKAFEQVVALPFASLSTGAAALLPNAGRFAIASQALSDTSFGVVEGQITTRQREGRWMNDLELFTRTYGSALGSANNLILHPNNLPHVAAEPATARVEQRLPRLENLDSRQRGRVIAKHMREAIARHRTESGDPSGLSAVLAWANEGASIRGADGRTSRRAWDATDRAAYVTLGAELNRLLSNRDPSAAKGAAQVDPAAQSSGPSVLVRTADARVAGGDAQARSGSGAAELPPAYNNTRNFVRPASPEAAAATPEAPQAAPRSAGAGSEAFRSEADRLLDERGVPRSIATASNAYKVASRMRMAVELGSGDDPAKRLILPTDNAAGPWILKPQGHQGDGSEPAPATPPGYGVGKGSTLILPQLITSISPEQVRQFGGGARRDTSEAFIRTLESVLKLETNNPDKTEIGEFLYTLSDQMQILFQGKRNLDVVPNSRYLHSDLVPNREKYHRGEESFTGFEPRMAFKLSEKSQQLLQSVIGQSITSEPETSLARRFAYRFLTNTVYITNFYPANINGPVLQALEKNTAPAARTIYEHYLSTQLPTLQTEQKENVIRILHQHQRLSSHLAQSIFTEMPQLREKYAGNPFPSITNLHELERVLGNLPTYSSLAMNEASLVPAQLAPDARFGMEIELKLRGSDPSRAPDSPIQQALRPYADQIELGTDFGSISELRTKGGLTISQMQTLLFPVVNIFHGSPELVTFLSNHVHVDDALNLGLSYVRFDENADWGRKNDTLELKPRHVNTQRLSTEDELPYSYNAALLIDYMIVAEALKGLELPVEAARKSYALAKKYGLEVHTTQLLLTAVENGRGDVVPNILRLHAHGKSHFDNLIDDFFAGIRWVSKDSSEYTLNVVPLEDAFDWLSRNPKHADMASLVAHRIFLPFNSQFSRAFFNAFDQVAYDDVSRLDFVRSSLLYPPQDVTSSKTLKDAVDLAALTVFRQVGPNSYFLGQETNVEHASQLLERALLTTGPASASQSAQERWQNLTNDEKRLVIRSAQDSLRRLTSKWGGMRPTEPDGFSFNLRDRARANAINNPEITEFQAVGRELENWLRDSTDVYTRHGAQAIAREALAVAAASTTPTGGAERRYAAVTALVRMSPEQRESLLARIASEMAADVTPLADLVASRSLGVGATDPDVHESYSYLASLLLTSALLRDSEISVEQSMEKWQALTDTRAKIKTIEQAQDHVRYLVRQRGWRAHGHSSHQPHLLLDRAASDATGEVHQYDAMLREIQDWLKDSVLVLSSAPQTVPPIAEQALKVALTDRYVGTRGLEASDALAQMTPEDMEALLTRVAQQLRRLP
jgi:hypothetical protein